MDSAAAFGFRRPGPGKAHDAIDELGRRARDGQRIPAQLIGRYRIFRKVVTDALVVHAPKRTVRHPGTDAIQPRATIDGSWRGKRRAGDLLGIEPIGTTLRRVL